jgi:hypothetical protein
VTVAIIKDRHVRIIIMRPETILHLEAGYIFADCFSSNPILLAFGRRTIHVTPTALLSCCQLRNFHGLARFTDIDSRRDRPTISHYRVVEKPGSGVLSSAQRGRAIY